MRELPEIIRLILASHPANVFFTVRAIDAHAEGIAVGLCLRSEFAGGSHTTSVLGCALDFIACIAGYDAIGNCSVSEFEASFHEILPLGEVVAMARLESVDSHYATYSSSLYIVNKVQDRLVASASGTLVTVRNKLTVIAGRHLQSGVCAN